MAIRLIDVDIREPLPTVHVNGCSSVWALVWSEGVPIGWTYIDRPGGDITADHMATEIGSQLGNALMRDRLYRSLMGQEQSSVVSRQPSVTVIICTRDRAESLEKTLESLSRVDYPAFETLVVDNCPSSESTAEVVSRYPSVRRVVEPLPGLDYARNTGIAEARGEIVAFIDDDATADPGWLAGLTAGFEDPGVACVTGLVVPAEMETLSQELFEVAYGGFGRGFERRVFCDGVGSKYASYRTSAPGTGCNMAFRKDVFSRIGLFDPALDVGTPTGGGGDTDMFHRLMRAGCRIAYRPEAVVRHRHRAGEEDFRRLIFNYGKSFSAFLIKCLICDRGARALTLGFTARWFFSWYVMRMVRPRPAGYKNTGIAMPRGLVALEAFGSLMGLWAYFKSRRRAASLASTGYVGGGRRAR